LHRRLRAAEALVLVLWVSSGALNKFLCEHTKCVRAEFEGVRLNIRELTTPTASLNTRHTFDIIPLLPTSSPMAISTCVRVDI
tara:strand:+ start:628 stop:876 length:249 start_codon:yes stop_codon:yes gene_type:complete